MVNLERKDSFEEIWITALWAMVAWLIWSIIILIFTIFIGSYTNLFSVVTETSKFWWLRVEPIYPIMMSVITLIWTSITSIVTYLILWKANPSNYKKNNVIFNQIMLLQVLIYICISPIYIIFGGTSFDNIIICYIIHVLVVIFWVNIILDILNNYRYVMIWIYWTFLWTFLTTIVCLVVHFNYSFSNSKFITLVFLIPLINFLIILIKKFFELAYFHFYRFTWTDPIWDIFYKIKKEEDDNEKEKQMNNFN